VYVQVHSIANFKRKRYIVLSKSCKNASKNPKHVEGKKKGELGEGGSSTELFILV
jgi:hypothetical protein